jgi:hypothetical protein
MKRFLPGSLDKALCRSSLETDHQPAGLSRRTSSSLPVARPPWRSRLPGRTLLGPNCSSRAKLCRLDGSGVSL